MAFSPKGRNATEGVPYRRSYAAWKCLWHLGFFDGLDFVERVERVRLVKEQEGVVAPRQNGGHIVAGFVLGVIDHADRAVPPRFGQRPRAIFVVEDQQLVRGARPVKKVLPR